ncbi:DsbA family protein [Photorhabdus aegyptia]|uniref:Protein-disulfide isomerase n=1 Tax=Photorhabdus aegyptia TaxID=2805098 RepID=A0A022PG30_9GAMM|nr:thioredoxin domain-containing protein [Photorhabdus aegyptia]EYU15097.1 protein-disulfide isomerase [Photorhabdus aegyptia]
MQSETKVNKVVVLGPIIIGGLVLVAAGFSVYTAVKTSTLDSKIKAVQRQLSDVSAKLTSMQAGMVTDGGDFKSAVQQALVGLEEDKLAQQRKDLFKGWENTSVDEKGRYIYGNPKARFTLINYEDLECPFCQRFHQTPKYLVDTANNGAINWEWRHFPLSFHEPMSTKGALIAECIGQQKGAQGFWAATNYWFTNTETNGKGFVGAEQMVALFQVDKAKYDACLTDKVIIKRIKADMDLGAESDVTGTPTTIVRDNLTGKEVAVVGAQPFAKFVGVIRGMVNEGQANSESNETPPAK